MQNPTANIPGNMQADARLLAPARPGAYSLIPVNPPAEESVVYKYFWAVLPLLVAGGVVAVTSTTTLPAWAFWSLVATPTVANIKMWCEQRQVANDYVDLTLEEAGVRVPPRQSFGAWCCTRSCRFFAPLAVGAGFATIIGGINVSNSTSPEEIESAKRTAAVAGSAISGVIATATEVLVKRFG